MSNDFNNQLRDLHEQLDPSIVNDPETQVKMAFMKDRVRELIERSAEQDTPEDPASLLEQLEESVVYLEAEHPTLVGLIRGVINSLSNSGI